MKFKHWSGSIPPNAGAPKKSLPNDAVKSLWHEACNNMRVTRTSLNTLNTLGTPPPQLKRVLIAEDHEKLREHLSRLIDEQEGFICVGEAANGSEALRLISETEPDVVLLDLAMPEMDGLRLIQKLKDWRPGIRCLVLSAHRDAAYVERAITSGADGYVFKSNPHEVTAALHAVTEGKAFYSEEIQMD